MKKLPLFLFVFIILGFFSQYAWAQGQNTYQWSLNHACSPTDLTEDDLYIVWRGGVSGSSCAVTAGAGGGGGTPTAITVADTTDSTSFCALFESATGDLGPKTDAGCTYDASNGNLTAGGVVTADGFAPNDSTATGTRMNLAAANTLGFTSNGTLEAQLSGAAFSPGADGGNSLGTTALGWQNIFGNTGFVINIENSDWVATHTAGILTVGTGDLRVITAGTNSASAVTVGGTQTLTSKTLTAPRFADLGFIADANGNELIILDTVGSAVNEITIANAATGNNATITASGETNAGITITGKGTKGVSFGNAVLEKVSALSDGATPALDASLGNVFTLTAGGNRTIAIPTNPTTGQKIIIAHTASGADRTLALNTGTGGFRFGTTITALTATTSGLTDYIGAIYNSTANKWDVVAYSKGF
jgi:hypothetical protein